MYRFLYQHTFSFLGDKCEWSIAGTYGSCVCVCARVHARVHAHMRTQSCLILWLMGCILPGSFVCGISQARLVERVAISSSRGFSRPRNRTLISCVSYVGGQILYHERHLGSLVVVALYFCLLLINIYLSIWVFFGCTCCGMWDVVSRPRTEPAPPALEAQSWSLNHWTN